MAIKLINYNYYLSNSPICTNSGNLQNVNCVVVPLDYLFPYPTDLFSNFS